MTRGAAWIETRGLTREYRVGSSAVRALDRVDLSVYRGEFLAIVGVSGSGKSTLLHLLGGLDTASSGQILVEGRDQAGTTEEERTNYRRKSVGFVFQGFHLIPSLTAEANVSLALTFQGTYGDERRIRAREALRRVGLESRRAHRPTELSGGEQQRVAIARAIVHRPPLLLADEPTGNLDQATSDHVVRLLNEIRAELGTTIVMVTHDQEIAAHASDRTLHLVDGRVARTESEAS